MCFFCKFNKFILVIGFSIVELVFLLLCIFFLLKVFSQLDKKVSLNNLKDDLEALKLKLSIEELEFLG
tara:strand:- start:491 stop:694 length:204 start_codon:yes stop_codon:yes gene_type:complete